MEVTEVLGLTADMEDTQITVTVDMIWDTMVEAMAWMRTGGVMVWATRGWDLQAWARTEDNICSIADMTSRMTVEVMAMAYTMVTGRIRAMGRLRLMDIRNTTDSMEGMDRMEDKDH